MRCQNQSESQILYLKKSPPHESIRMTLGVVGLHDILGLHSSQVSSAIFGLWGRFLTMLTKRDR
jgi:hypothetical protein